MHILITNDDGIGAAGLGLLAAAAREFGRTTIIAPKTEQSGISHRLTFDRPIHLEKLKEDCYQVDGTPADCVRVGIAMLDQKFDWVLSGVNDGANLGVEIYYSGTVAAAREAALLGVPSVALSQYRKKYAAPFNWMGQKETVIRVIKSLTNDPLNDPLVEGSWINVNLPDRENEHPEVVPCQPDMTPLPNEYVESPDGGVELSFRYRDRPRKANLDVDVCFRGQISISHHKTGEQV